MPMSTTTDQNQSDDVPFAEQAALTTLLGNHPKVKIISVLLSEGRDTNISHIAEQAGMSRSTVYKHIDDLRDLNVVEKTREISGSPLYQMNRQSDVAKKLAQTEWALVDEVASNFEE